MELVNDFTVNAPIDHAWHTLTDVERIAPCLPGAQLQEIEGEHYRGVVKVKVGPITAQFKGQAMFVEKDDDEHRAVLKAEGRDTGGKGNASALITAQLEPVTEEATKVVVTTDLTITGKVAQFGRGALADVSDKLLKQFVHNLETTVLAEEAALQPSEAASDGDAATPAGGAPTAGAAEDASGVGPEGGEAAGRTQDVEDAHTPAEDTGAAAEVSSVRKVDSAPVEPIDLIETAGAPMLKRLLPLVAGIVLIVVLLRRRRSH
jgi:carbon monoxide dehydrogenase subunit G